MYDVITIGTTTVDLYFQSSVLTSSGGRFELAMGGKYFTDHFYESLGGGATNVAIGLQSQGFRTSVVSLIGKNDFRPMITEKLQKAGVSFLHSKPMENYLNISCILLSQSGEKTVINYQTPHQHLFTDEKDYLPLLRSQTIYMANIPDISHFDKYKLLKYLKSNGRMVIANLGVMDCRRSKEQLDHLLSNIDILIINAHEFADIAKVQYEKLNFKKDVVTFFLKEHSSKTVIITDGAKGSFGYQHGKVYCQEAVPPAEIVDSTGAGDGYSAGFIAGFLRHSDIEKAMLSGTKYASKILAKIGAN